MRRKRAPFLDFVAGVCYTDSPEGMQMQVVVLNGTLTEAEQDVYVQQAIAVYPVSTTIAAKTKTAAGSQGYFSGTNIRRKK